MNDGWIGAKDRTQCRVLERVDTRQITITIFTRKDRELVGLPRWGPHPVLLSTSARSARLLRTHPRAQTRRPAGLFLLRGANQRRRASADAVVPPQARRNDRALADCHRRDQRAVGADEGALANYG